MLRAFVHLALLATASTAAALDIQLDFSYDAAGPNFFDLNPTARAAVEAAAADLSAVILPSLGAVPDDVFTGSSNATTATADWYLSPTNPSTGATITIEDFAIPQDVFTIYVGMRPLTSSAIGQGGPAGAGVGISVSGNPSRYGAAIDALEASSNAIMPRGGPIIGSLSGSLGGHGYTLSYGPLAGNLWFDSDTNNNGTPDFGTLSSFWHYDHTTAVAAGKNDLYSVALHEMMHALGFGTSETWTDLVSGMQWLGPEVQGLLGVGSAVIAGDGDHLAAGFFSTRVSDGLPQEVVMDPNLTTGTRKYLTHLDVAFLGDLGYATVPEPGTAALLAMGAAVCALRRVRRS